MEKSQIFFSQNVSPEKANRITEQAGIARTDNLGKYLGVPSLHGRMSTSMYAPLIERIDGSLDGWKNKYLTLAGRHILAQSVLNTIPYYAMQTTYIPMGVCEKIEGKIRKFIWGSSYHLIDWNTVTKAKHEGGLGLQRLRDMNLTFLDKVGWQLINDRKALWAQVISAKYLQEEKGNNGLISKHGASNLWRGICRATPIINTRVRKVVRSGQNMSFWNERWLKGNPLIHEAGINITDVDMNKKVADYWVPKQGWNQNDLVNILPSATLNELNYYILDESGKRDVLYWEHESSGRFSVSSAYNISVQGTRKAGHSDWCNIWKIKVPNRICMFL